MLFQLHRPWKAFYSFLFFFSFILCSCMCIGKLTYKAKHSHIAVYLADSDSDMWLLVATLWLDLQITCKAKTTTSVLFTNRLQSFCFLQMSTWPVCTYQTLMPIWQSCLMSRPSTWASTRMAPSNLIITGRANSNVYIRFSTIVLIFCCIINLHMYNKTLFCSQVLMSMSAGVINT